VSTTDEVLEATRASDRQRLETKARIRHARHEGRIPQALCDVRVKLADKAVTTDDLTRLTSDLGAYEGPHPVRIMAGLLVAVIVAAAWEPYFLSGHWWIALAAPVTALAPFCLWAAREYLA
jgi:Domain of unknown function (DUF1707)